MTGQTAVCRVPSAARAGQAHWSHRKGPFRPKCTAGAITRVDEERAGTMIASPGSVSSCCPKTRTAEPNG